MWPFKSKKRSYEGASKERRTQGWNTTAGSVNAEISLARPILVSRCRDLRRNNAHANKIINTITANVVGPGVLTQFNGSSKDLDKIKKLWREWSMTMQCDFEGRQTYGGLQKIICDAVSESGEIVIRMRTTPISKKNPVPLQLQLLESDFICTEKTGDNIVQGIEFDSNGRRVAYHLYKSHPGDSFNLIDSVRILAKDIIHPFEILRPGQVRGVPRLAPVIIRLKDLHDFESAELVRQKISSCFSGFIHDIDSGSDLDGEDQSTYGSKIEPGMIEVLEPGKTITFANPPTKEGYKDYMSSQLHSIAAGVGIAYEQLTGELSEVNYSSARMGRLEVQRLFRMMQKNVIMNQVLDVVAERFLECCRILGLDTEKVDWKHIPPRVEMIDPIKEIPAKVAAIRAGFENLSDVIAETGQEPDEVFAQRKLDNDTIDRLEFIYDTDPRRTSSNGRRSDVAPAVQE